MINKSKGQLIIIGGHEEKEGERLILHDVAKATKDKSGLLVMITVATSSPEESAKSYRKAFADLGIPNIEMLDIRSREEALDPERVKMIEEAETVFFTGGDQLRITSQFGGSPLCQAMHRLLERNGTVVGTSAGAAAMPETMLLSGGSDSSFRIDDLAMAPGLGLINGVVIDSHFAERGRIGRLLGAVAYNPVNIGLGIDEDTAIIVRRQKLEVIGTGAVYVVDGAHLSFSSLPQDKSSEEERVASLGDMCMHILAAGDKYDLATRRPLFAKSASEAS